MNTENYAYKKEVDWSLFNMLIQSLIVDKSCKDTKWKRTAAGTETAALMLFVF